MQRWHTDTGKGVSQIGREACRGRGFDNLENTAVGGGVKKKKKIKREEAGGGSREGGRV